MRTTLRNSCPLPLPPQKGSVKILLFWPTTRGRYYEVFLLRDCSQLFCRDCFPVVQIFEVQIIFKPSERAVALPAIEKRAFKIGILVGFQACVGFERCEETSINCPLHTTTCCLDQSLPFDCIRASIQRPRFNQLRPEITIVIRQRCWAARF